MVDDICTEDDLCEECRAFEELINGPPDGPVANDVYVICKHQKKKCVSNECGEKNKTPVQILSGA